MEEWRSVVGFEGIYEVSNMGRVRSLDRIESYLRKCQYSGKVLHIRRKKKGKILRPGPHKTGHLSVVLGRGNTRAVHLLVLEAFAGPRPDGMESLHRDDNPSDNRFENLRWGTRAENIQDAIKNGGKPLGSKTWNSKLTEDDVIYIRSKASMKGYSMRLAERFGVSSSVICNIANKKTWKHLP